MYVFGSEGFVRSAAMLQVDTRGSFLVHPFTHILENDHLPTGANASRPIQFRSRLYAWHELSLNASSTYLLCTRIWRHISRARSALGTLHRYPHCLWRDRNLTMIFDCFENHAQCTLHSGSGEAHSRSNWRNTWGINLPISIRDMFFPVQVRLPCPNYPSYHQLLSKETIGLRDLK